MSRGDHLRLGGTEAVAVALDDFGIALRHQIAVLDRFVTFIGCALIASVKSTVHSM